MADKNIIDAMWDDSPIDVSTEVNFIWSIANKLRGPYRSDKYKDVIIPMTIIRRFECALAPTKAAVVAKFQKRSTRAKPRCISCSELFARFRQRLLRVRHFQAPMIISAECYPL